jgi:hypothetical protein
MQGHVGVLVGVDENPVADSPVTEVVMSLILASKQIA